MNFGTRGKSILAAVDDLFFAAKLHAMARRGGADLIVVKSLAEAESRPGPFDVLVADMESRGFPCLDLMAAMAVRWPSAEKWAFAAHGRTELMETARRMGWTRVMPRGAFEARFPEALGTRA
jgi:hypothetical protein